MDSAIKAPCSGAMPRSSMLLRWFWTFLCPRVAGGWRRFRAVDGRRSTPGHRPPFLGGGMLAAVLSALLFQVLLTDESMSREVAQRRLTEDGLRRSNRALR